MYDPRFTRWRSHNIPQNFLSKLTTLYAGGTAYFQNLNEAVVVVDTLSKQTSKSLTEAITIVDSVIKQTLKAFSEVVVIQDSLAAIRTFLKTLNEQIAIVDTFSKQTGKVLNESIAIVDTLTRAMTRVFSEVIAVVDGVFKQIAKTFTEVISIRWAAVASFAGTGYLKIPHNASINVGNNDSYSVFIRFKSTIKVDQSPTEKWYDDGPPVINKYPWAIRGPHATSGNVNFNIYDGTNNPGVGSGGDLADGQWHSILGVRDITLQKIRKYIDGVQAGGEVTDTTVTLGTGDVSSDRHVTIGARSPSGQRFTGELADFMLFQGVVSAADALALHRSGTLPSNTLLIRMPLDEDNGNLAYDLSGNNNHATDGANVNWVDSILRHAPSLTLSTNKVISEEVNIVDTLSRAFTKVITEIVSVTDTLTKVISRAFTETIPIIDTFTGELVSSAIVGSRQIILKAVTAVNTILKFFNHDRTLKDKDKDHELRYKP